jgi:hypothetical protein
MVAKFFRKIETGAKNFFKKGGQLETGLRKAVHTVAQGSGVLGSIGKVARGLAPVAGAILGPEAGVALMGADKALQEAKKTGRAIGSGLAGVRGAVHAGEGHLGNTITGIGNATKAGIEAVKSANAPKPAISPEPAPDMIGLAGLPNFA